MKSYIEKPESEEQEQCFPILKEWQSSGLVVLFYGNGDGVCVHPGSSIREIGERGPWVSCFDLSWRDFKGKIILEN
jgi:hypothetical protein